MARHDLTKIHRPVAGDSSCTGPDRLARRGIGWENQGGQWHKKGGGGTGTEDRLRMGGGGALLTQVEGGGGYVCF